MGARPQLGLCSWRLWPAGPALGCSYWGRRVPQRSSCCLSACPRWGPIRLRLGGTCLAWPALSWHCCCPRSFPEVAPSPPRLPHSARYPPPRCHGQLVRRRPLAGPGAHRLLPGYVRRTRASPAGHASGGAAPPTPKPHPSSPRPILGPALQPGRILSSLVLGSLALLAPCTGQRLLLFPLRGPATLPRGPGIVDTGLAGFHAFKGVPASPLVRTLGHTLCGILWPVQFEPDPHLAREG